MYFAHSENGKNERHLLKDHLSNTARRAAAFARSANEAEYFRYAALIHDAGKYQDEFQSYLKNGGIRGSVPHAVHGAALSYEDTRQNPIIFSVLGHHQGLLDVGDVQSAVRRIKESSNLELVRRRLTEECSEILDIGRRLRADNTFKTRGDLRAEMFTRFLFSALVDADWLDTESHFSPESSMTRPAKSFQAEELLSHLEHYFQKLPSDGPINQLRTSVREEAAGKASEPVGFFSLNVPTGLGKTLTSAYWALKHAQANNLRRLIVVLPYINIIDQTVAKFREIFGDDAVLEHHSSFLEGESVEDEETRFEPKKLATENWDYPVIVTTTVQFFESLFANRPSRCRKVHNISDSVVIFDEVQSLRQELVLPTLEMLKQVQAVMNTSFLFCTATMPAFEARPKFSGLSEIQSLISAPQVLFEKTNRVDYTFIREFSPISSGDLASTIANKPGAVLAVLNTKKDALAIYSAVRDLASFDLVYHLSTSMCAAHRRAVIASIRSDLRAGRRIFVSSTQLIEAGVDFDFPFVFRALAPLESVIQAAGRCNREGRQEKGSVFIFNLEDGGMPPGLYSTSARHTQQLLSADRTFLGRHEGFGEYYRQIQTLFVQSDKNRITENRRELCFKAVADSYRLIDSKTSPVFVRSYDERSKELFEDLKVKTVVTRSQIRAIQPYVVNLYPGTLFENQHVVDNRTIEGVAVWEGQYDNEIGLVVGNFSPDQLIV